MVIVRNINSDIALLLRKGGVGVLPTDTIYGIVGSALKKKTVERIYRLRKRNPKKPMIVLIASVADLKRFGVKVDSKTARILKKLWPHLRHGYGGQAGKISVILPCPSKKFSYLHRGTRTLAFRLPKPVALRKLLESVGPLVAPSANWEGERPARTIREAKKYFSAKGGSASGGGNRVDPHTKRVVGSSTLKGRRATRSGAGVDFYVDGGKLKSLPSTLVSIRNGRIIVLRKGAGRLPA